MFGGNSNWRGPIWMPVNMLILRALVNYYACYGNAFTIECPTGFYEYFHGDNGAGIGASHQTGWTGIVARIMHMFATTTAEQVTALGQKATIVETKSEWSAHASDYATR